MVTSYNEDRTVYSSDLYCVIHWNILLDNFEYSEACNTMDHKALSKLQAAKLNRPKVRMWLQQTINIFLVPKINIDQGIKALKEDLIQVAIKSSAQLFSWIYMLIICYEIKPWLTYNASIGDLICNITKEGFDSIGIQICMWISLLLFLQDLFLIFLGRSLLRMMRIPIYQPLP